MTHKSSDKLLESLSALADGEISELELHRLLRAFADDVSLQQTWQNYHLIRDVLLSESPGSIGLAEGSLLKGIREAIDAEHDESGSPGAGRDKFRQKLNLRSDSGTSRSPGHGDRAGEAGTVNNRDAHRYLLEASGSETAAGAGEIDHSGPGSELGSELESFKNARVWHAWLGKSAVAASVAVAFVVGLGQASNWSGQSEPSAVLAANVEQPGIASMGAPLGFELPTLESRNVSTEMNRNFSPALAVHNNPLIEPDASSEARAQRILNQLHIMHAERATANGGFGILPFARVSEMDMSTETRVQR